MLGYLILILAVFPETVLGVFSKKLSEYTTDTRELMLANTVRMSINVAAGVLLVLVSAGTLTALAPSSALLWTALVNGIATFIINVFWFLSVRENAYMLTGVFMTMGMFIPILLSFFLFKEELRFVQLIGLVLMIAASYMMSAFNKGLKGKTTPKMILYGVICCIGGGFQDFSSKLFQYNCPGMEESAFSFYSFLYTAVFFTLFWLGTLIFGRKAPRPETGTLSPEAAVHASAGAFLRKTIWFIAGAGLFLLLSIWLRTVAAASVPAIVMYPVFKGGSLILSLVCSALIFREKPDIYCYLGLLFSLVALVIINVF